jgi:hypothetical protein
MSGSEDEFSDELDEFEESAEEAKVTRNKVRLFLSVSFLLAHFPLCHFSSYLFSILDWSKI